MVDTVHVFKDISIRSTGRGTWLEAGEYEVLRDLGTKLLIIINDGGWQLRQLTIVHYSEVLEGYRYLNG